jgi:hypothetical protein
MRNSTVKQIRKNAQKEGKELYSKMKAREDQIVSAFLVQVSSWSLKHRLAMAVKILRGQFKAVNK